MVSGNSEKLVLTERGTQWLNNFDEYDRPIARQLAASLTLVSETEFARELIAKIEALAEKIPGKIALYSVREVAENEKIFNEDGTVLDATPRGHDIGSEGRVAHLLRNLVRLNSERFLNSPTLSIIKSERCENIIFLDDFIGSGKRVDDFLWSFYSNSTIKSWFSLKRFKTFVVCYSGTEPGMVRVRAAKTAPGAILVRSCPTIENKFWTDDTKKSILRVCKKYARKNKMGHALGFGKVGALLVFEHSCPNNVPIILWGSREDCSWIPIFEGKAVSLEARRIFPSEILQNSSVNTLIAAGEERIAAAANIVINRPLPGEWLATLSLFEKGIRRVDALEGVSGMNHAQAIITIERCVSAGLLTHHWRLTKRGSQELVAARRAGPIAEKIIPKTVEVDYYPYALRGQ